MRSSDVDADGSWSLVDLNSANGTYLNYAGVPIEPRTAIPLSDGDRIHVGGWTTLTLSLNPGPDQES